MPVTNGQQLVAPFTGSPSSALNLAASVGPNALLQSASYPVPSSTSTGPLTSVPTPAGGGNHWSMANPGGSGSTVMTGLWGSPTQPYVYNNSPSNLGGIVPAGGMTIDGYAYAAGTYVFQFMDFTQVGDVLEMFGTWTADTVFRGCRSRNQLDAPGFINMQGYTGYLALHYCEFGGVSAAWAGTWQSTVALDTAGFGGSIRILRCYASYASTGFQPNATGAQCEMIENYVEKLTYSDVGSPPVPAHLNGICLNGGNANCLFLRNHVVIETPDENGATVDQTDCIALFQDFGTFPGTGTNSDGSAGYVIQGNYAGGTGYCFYLGQNSGTQPDTVNNVTFTQNLVTTSFFPAGGVHGPAAAIPAWGSFGNTEYSDFWADGPLAGAQDIFGATVTTITNTFAGGTPSGNVTAGNSGGASGTAFDTVNAAFSGTVTYDSTHAHLSPLAGHCFTPSSANANVVWGNALTAGTDQAQVWFRMYCFITTWPSRTEPIWIHNPPSGFGASLKMTSTGTLQFQNSSGTTQFTTTAVMPTSAWFRLEGFVIGSTTAGQMQLKYFSSPDSAVPTETDTSGSAVNTGGLIHSVQYGLQTQSAWDIWFDGLGASTAGYLGPISSGGSHMRHRAPMGAIAAAATVR